jgi:hypothetical protein
VYRLIPWFLINFVPNTEPEFMVVRLDDALKSGLTETQMMLLIHEH